MQTGERRLLYPWVELAPFALRDGSNVGNFVAELTDGDTGATLTFNPLGQTRGTAKLEVAMRGFQNCTLGETKTPVPRETNASLGPGISDPSISQWGRYDLQLPPGGVTVNCAFDKGAMPWVDDFNHHRQQFSLLSPKIAFKVLRALGVPANAVPVSEYTIAMPPDTNPNWIDQYVVTKPGDKNSPMRTLSTDKPGLSNIAVVRYTPEHADLNEQTLFMLGGVLFGLSGQGLYEFLKICFTEGATALRAHVAAVARESEDIWETLSD